MSLDRYLLRQCFVPFVVAVIILTSVVWLTQALQRADVMVVHGQGFATFIWLSLLIIPSLLSILIPFALFAGAMYALHRLHGDGEIAVIFAAGVGRVRLALPFLLVAAGAAAAVLWINVDLMPWSYRRLKEEIVSIRTDLARFVLRSGEFTSLPGGFTIYSEKVLQGGRFIGLLVSDYRNPEARTTYMAQRASLQETAKGPVLRLATGNIQRRDQDGQIEIVDFDRTTINLDRLGAFPKAQRILEPTERYLHELLRPDLSQPWDRRNASLLVAEGHARLASPLYTFAFVLIALAALLTGPGSRARYSLRIAGACLAAGALQIAGVMLVSVSAAAEAYWLPYVAPSAVIVCLSLALAWRRPLLKRNRS